MSKKKDIVVTGIGLLSPHGQGIPSFLNALQNGKSFFAHSKSFPELDYPVITSEIIDFGFDEIMNKCIHISEKQKDKICKLGRRSPKVIQASLIAALEAWNHAGLSKRRIDPTRIGLVVAGQNTTQRYLYEMHGKDLNYLPPSYAMHFMDTDQIGSLSEAFEIQGESFTVGGASASGNVAIIQANRLIQQNIIDVCLVVGVLADLSPLELQAFYNIGAFGGKKFAHEPSKACRPFDENREGFILGQASACLILESRISATKAQVPLLGTLVGTALCLDANRLPDPRVEGEIRAMNHAIADAGIEKKAIQYINTHGTSSVLGDIVEISAIKSVFGSGVKNIVLNSTKSITGHCLWSAGVVEAIATLLQMQHKFVHVNLNLENAIDQDCIFSNCSDAPFDIKYALSNSFGFGGINTSVIFKKVNEFDE